MEQPRRCTALVLATSVARWRSGSPRSKPAVLSDLLIKPRYSTGQQDIIADFFVPCLGQALLYDRAVGYFSSTFYTLIRMPLVEFASRGGKMRLICSPELSPQDIDAIQGGYESRVLGDAIGRISTESPRTRSDRPPPSC